MICFALFAEDEETVLASHVENIRRFNPGCKIVLYNGGKDPNFGKQIPLPVCPYSRPLPGQKGRFLLDIMRWLEQTTLDYDYLVPVTSDVLFVRTGYKAYVDELMDGYDCMGVNLCIQPVADVNPYWQPGQSMWREWERWQPFFQGESFYGTLCAMQVYRRSVVQALVRGLDVRQLEQLLTTTEVVALEEILPITLAVSRGARPRSYPVESTEFVRLGAPLELEDVLLALRQPQVYFVHPVAGAMENPARQWVMAHLHEEPYPQTLTISWGGQQSGVDTALLYRLHAMNAIGAQSHAFFYVGAAGLHNYSSIPYAISKQSDDLEAYLRQNPFDVVTFVNTLHHLDVLRGVRFAGKAIFEFHVRSKRVLEELKRINEREDGGRIDAVVVPSEHMADVAHMHLYKRTELPIYVARNTLDAKWFCKQPHQRFMMQYHIPEEWANDPLVGWVGRLETNKNWRLLLRLFRQVKAKQKQVRLLIASDLTKSMELNDFFKEAAKHNLLGDLLVLPNVSYEKMPQFYSLIGASDGVLVSTSFREGYPYHLLEAQACFCPVVCTAISGSKEIVQHNVTGLTFPLGKAALGALYVQRLMTSKALRKKVILNARNLVKRRNDIQQNVKDYAAWLRDLAGG
jgi:glycosyltransferase involved in cell wall biosynthesis